MTSIRPVVALLVVVGVLGVVNAGCSSNGTPAGTVHGTAQLGPPKAKKPRPTTTTSSSTTTTTTTTTTPPPTAPPPRAPFPVKLGSLCILAGEVGSSTAGQAVACVDHKGSGGKPYADHRLRWTLTG